MEMYKDSSFIKVLAEPISSTLLFPDEFVRKYGDILPQEAAFLMTEDKYGRCWKVEVARLANGRFCFANGWPQFVGENPQIRALDFFVFHLVDASTFRVSVFGNDGLKKPSSTLRRPPSPPPPQDVENSRRSDCTELGESSRRRGVEMNETKSFTVESLARYHLYCLTIPARFGERMGLEYGKSITLTNEDGVSFPVLVRKPLDDGKFCLGGVDWEEYWIKNSLTVGNRVTFSIIGDDFGTLHVSREGLIIPTLPKKKMGRPRKF